MTQPRLSIDARGTTAPIFDDAVYLSEALSLPVNRSEDDLDAELALLARESGIQDPYRFLCPGPDVSRDMSRALSTLTVDSDPRSSMSIHSHDTQSTSFTSTASRTSRDHHIYSFDRSPATRMPPKLMRASVSLDNHHGSLNTTLPMHQQRHSISAVSVAPSQFSTQSLPTPLRRKRASGIFSIFRKDPSVCTSRSHQGHSRSRGLKVECGHSLSPYAIRVHIQEALQSGGQSVPKCCGTDLPRWVLESVLTKEETDLVLDGLSQNPVAQECDSMFDDEPASSLQVSPVPHCTTPQASPLVSPKTPTREPRYESNIDLTLANEAFKTFKIQQKEQFERISAFERSQRKALLAHHEHLLECLKAQHRASKDEQVEQHAFDLDQLEELQILAEHDMRKAHSQETQNVATALKHMEAYCLATNVNHPEHLHTVSEDDFKKLDRQRQVQANLPRNHENAINVLRARQERETKRRLRKQQDELAHMDVEYIKQRTKYSSEHAKELERLEAVIDGRRKRVMQRWDLKFEMWRRDWEAQHATTLTAPLEHEHWPLEKVDTNTTIAEESLLAQYVRVGA